MSKKTTSKKKKSAIVVNRKFLNDLATVIYDSKTRRFLRLCNGTLQNGPDPTDEKRPMHCGLGELYYAMTGNQPEHDGVREDDVVENAVKLSTFENPDALRDRAVAGIKSLGLPKAMEYDLMRDVNDMEDDDLMTEEEQKFRSILNAIPETNDMGPCTEACTVADFRTRSKNVAAKLREAAKLLPA